jgi:GrpB-like predicted nucleotidyltransferase (UPF0157 family)
MKFVKNRDVTTLRRTNQRELMPAVTLAAYDPLWPEEFRAEAARIARSCEHLEIRLEHVGSTSVPGLSAKPIIDIAAGVPPRVDRRPYIQALKELGYEHLGAHGIPGRDFFRRGRPRSHHVHMLSWSSEQWREHLLFRDHLRSHDDVRLEYEILKRQLARTHADERHRYQSGKGPFIQAILRKARLTSA